jgi:APA family basic amino acid/polyamine antiporter
MLVLGRAAAVFKHATPCGAAVDGTRSLAEVYAMARDGLLPAAFGKVHPRYRTPHHATMLTGVAVAVLAALVPIGEAADMTNIGTLFAFVLVCIGVLVLRRLRPQQPRPFRVPLMPLVPLLGIAACLGLMAFLPLITWWRFAVWTVVGVVVYVLYGMRRSKLALSDLKGRRTRKG